jgi:DNA invertase Pin-like site-specific DNA recombinase
MITDSTQKVTAAHLKRSAYLYVRQSTPRQVVENTESRQRQYALRERGLALGWAAEQIIVIDCDLGQSGASAVARDGFQKLVTEVSMGRAGIVMGLEVSRLARNCADWHRLLQICAITDTLILDEDGIYNPTHFNDRLLLGLKGTMSEAELHLIRSRMQGGLLQKAKRGEFLTLLPIGFVYDEEGRVVLDPDQQVQQALRLFFATFRRVGSAYGVIQAFQRQGILFPQQGYEGSRPSPLRWGALSHSQAVRILRNPRYAGAYAFGKTRFRKKLDAPGGRSQPVPREQWHSLIRDAHPGYISWQEYEENLRSLDENIQFLGLDHRGPAREGPALLQGLVICGVCGRRMHTIYHPRKTGLIPCYRCQGPSEAERSVHGHCQYITGDKLDEAIAEVLLENMTPVALEVALAVQQELESRLEEADRLRRAQVERARYEADLARRRFMRVDPENRLVADSLEKEWNEKLRMLAEAQQEYERKCQSDQAKLSSQQRERILALAADFPRLWREPSTPDRERKRMVRLLIEDVTLRKSDHVAVHVRFKGGAARSFTLPVATNWCVLRENSPEVVAEIDRLLDHHTPSQIAAILNQRGIRTGAGFPFDKFKVSQLARSRGLKSRYSRLRAAGLLTVSEMAKKFGVQEQTIHKWHRLGRLRAHIYNDRDSCLFEDTDQRPFRAAVRQRQLSKERGELGVINCGQEAQYEA